MEAASCQEAERRKIKKKKNYREMCCAVFKTTEAIQGHIDSMLLIEFYCFFTLVKHLAD